jgi:hypothetical protein
MWFTWTARADDGELPASGPASLFDLRGHTIPLDNSTAWNSALYQAQDESLPAELGSWGSGHIEGLLPCTSYHFGVRARDDHSQDGGFASASFQTNCDGGGGGFSARQVSGGEDGTGAAGTSPGPATMGGVSAPSSALSSAVYGSASVASAGSVAPTAGLLVVETRREGVEGWRVTLSLRETPQGSAPPAATITVEQSDAGSEPDTLGRFEPSAADNVLGLCSLRERGRLGIPGVHRIERVVPHLKTRTGDHVLASALHSRLGALGAAFIASGGGVEFALGDSLVLIYSPAPEPLADAASWYVLVRRTSDAPPIPMGSRRGRVGEALPVQFALHQNRPNPFRGTTTIAFDLPAESPVTLEVFDLLGRRVATLADASYRAGRHSVEWDLRDLSGSRVRPGVYAYRLSAGAFRERRKMNVLE